MSEATTYGVAANISCIAELILSPMRDEGSAGL